MWTLTVYAIPHHTGYHAPQSSTVCKESASQFHISAPPYDNYFFSDCHTSVQVVVTSPAPMSNLTIIGPRLLVAWPGGNSGIVGFFAPQDGQNGSLAITLENSTTPLAPIFKNNTSGPPVVGISGRIRFNTSAILTVAILGSIRTIRDFTEGPSLLVPKIQDAVVYSQDGEKVSLGRTWLDNVTETHLSFTARLGGVSLNHRTVVFEAGVYSFEASYNYPQLEQLNSIEVLKPQSTELVTQFSDQTASLSFLSYTTKLLAGAWRFLTYFGRDSMISLLLLQPVLSEGEGGAVEAVISAVLERINRSDGSICHEETIGDYATFLNMQGGLASTAPQYDYKMIDSDYYLPIVIEQYFVRTAVGQRRSEAFLQTQASVNPKNEGLTYADLARLNAEKIMNTSVAFAADGGQVKGNLIHLKKGQIVGQWRDSTYGIGGGRVPYDVNTALVPAALRSISALSNAGYFPDHPGWKTDAADFAKVWEDETLQFFEVQVPQASAIRRVEDYVKQSGFQGPANTDNITGNVSFYGLALEGNNNQAVVQVLNTDDCFRLFLLNTTNQSQLSAFLSQVADHILQPFPIGLSTSVGLLIANPAYGEDLMSAENWTTNAYHGTVVWSWQLAMMAAGLERQLVRCDDASAPNFCYDQTLHGKVKTAYNHVWDLIQANHAQLSSEVWSWVWRDGAFTVEALGNLPPAPGASPTESDVRQLWSLTFIAVRRNEKLK
ncbi:glycogen debranching enzyme [Trichodelitschia bisporula]|uniref:Glycogen debranching enzyme n=1 Tax=Trichodelitschia bisporula TaxID=703511 RepID=A0A6G1I5U2_9PEZI|nr:glycogen debranching enzyme [Trichodelitschia bisporula]